MNKSNGFARCLDDPDDGKLADVPVDRRFKVEQQFLTKANVQNSVIGDEPIRAYMPVFFTFAPL